MILKKLSTWWRSYPQKKRVKIIASVLLIFAGSEAIILAPVLFDIALMIDIGGMAFVLTAIRSSVSVSMMQARSFAMTLVKPIMMVFRAGEIIENWDFGLSPKHYWLMNRIVTRSAAASLIIGIGLLVTKTLIRIA